MAPKHHEKKSADDPDKVKDTRTKPAPAPKGGDSSKVYNGGPKRPTTAISVAQPVAAVPPINMLQIENPSYGRASNQILRHFARQYQVAGFFRDAANKGFEDFKIRSSVAYNDKEGSDALKLFEFALAMVPAAQALAGVMQELKTGAKAAELLAEAKTINKAVTASRVPQRIRQGWDAERAAKQAAPTADRLESKSEQIERELHKSVDQDPEGSEKAINSIGAATDGIAKLADDSGNETEAQQRGDFEIRTISEIGDLSRAAVIGSWKAEDAADAMIGMLQYCDASYDLLALVNRTLGKPFDSADVIRQTDEAATNFELQLYLRYYLDAGVVTYVTTDNDGVVTHKYEGLPDAVFARFGQLKREIMLLAHPNLRRENRSKSWTGQKF